MLSFCFYILLGSSELVIRLQRAKRHHVVQSLPTPIYRIALLQLKEIGCLPRHYWGHHILVVLVRGREELAFFVGLEYLLGAVD